MTRLAYICCTDDLPFAIFSPYRYIPGDPYFTEKQLIKDWAFLARRYKGKILYHRGNRNALLLALTLCISSLSLH